MITSQWNVQSFKYMQGFFNDPWCVALCNTLQMHENAHAEVNTQIVLLMSFFLGLCTQGTEPIQRKFQYLPPI